MSEYIEREALIKSLEFVTNDTTCPIHIAAEIDQIIAQEPAADVVEVVRCKECKQWRRNIGFVDSPNGHCFYHYIDTNGNDFCSYGEKMDGKGEGDNGTGKT